jgi:adenylate cyclase
VFVGRQGELDRLAGFQEDARQGRGRVVFIAGEAGSGKSALAGEFVRRAEARDEGVIAATGECNAQTGAGDPYLPFRQVLAELMGGEDGRQAGRTASETNAARLREFVRVASATLLEVGPDLVGLFIPGGALLAKIATAAARQGKLADKLAANLKAGGSSHGTSVDQERIFEQYSQLLIALSRERTLILVLDDLHWADSASLNLLFHLARQITERRIPIVGTYRPDDVALGRGDGRAERHPLEPVLNEIKRYEGDVAIDLGEGRAAEAQVAAAHGVQVVDYIAGHAPPELRASFLALPHIAALRAAA